jgi:hypothetical protein
MSDLNKYSRQITQPVARRRAGVLRGRFTEADMDKAQVGISSVWSRATRATCTCSTSPPR